jgi:hypothetical protein
MAQPGGGAPQQTPSRNITRLFQPSDVPPPNPVYVPQTPTFMQNACQYLYLEALSVQSPVYHCSLFPRPSGVSVVFKSRVGRYAGVPRGFARESK